jgi:hypothetical protein
MEGQSEGGDTALFFLRRQIKVGGQRHARAALPPNKETRCPFYRMLGGPHGRYGRVRKILSTRIRFLYLPAWIRSPYLPAHSNSILKW